VRGLIAFVTNKLSKELGITSSSFSIELQHAVMVNNLLCKPNFSFLTFEICFVYAYILSLVRKDVEIPECGCTRSQFVASETSAFNSGDTPRCSSKANHMRGTKQKVLSYCIYGDVLYYLPVNSQ
jgi:hypothetical protein